MWVDGGFQIEGHSLRLEDVLDVLGIENERFEAPEEWFSGSNSLDSLANKEREKAEHNAHKTLDDDDDVGWMDED